MIFNQYYNYKNNKIINLYKSCESTISYLSKCDNYGQH